jgi:hypothetical protein
MITAEQARAKIDPDSAYKRNMSYIEDRITDAIKYGNTSLSVPVIGTFHDRTLKDLEGLGYSILKGGNIFHISF